MKGVIMPKKRKEETPDVVEETKVSKTVKMEEKPVKREGTKRPAPFKEYDVKVVVPNLNLRKGPGKGFPKVGLCKPGLQTIVAEKNGYGRRADGLWIALEFCEKV